jgi:hypothetical protein
MKSSLKIFLVLGLVGFSGVVSGCGSSSSSSSASEDSSVSGVAAGAVGGALSNSSSSGTLSMNLKSVKASRWSLADLNFIPDAMAMVSCPTYASTGADCQASGDDMWLSYSDCTFAGHDAWNGVQALISSSSASCGSFPRPAANGSLIRQYVQSAGALVPYQLSLTSSFGTTAVIDDATANLGNFDGDSITDIANGGYGSDVGFNSSDARDSVTVDHRIYVSGVFDHSVDGQVAVDEVAGASSRVVTGSVKVYHNLLKVVGTATFNDVVHSDTCCMPIGGSISTVFSAGTNVSPTAIGKLMVGKTETLTFTGCGTGVLQAYDGTTSSVSLSRCF